MYRETHREIYTCGETYRDIYALGDIFAWGNTYTQGDTYTWGDICIEQHLQGIHARGRTHQDTRMVTHTQGYPQGHLHRGNTQGQYAWENKYAWVDILMGDIYARG